MIHTWKCHDCVAIHNIVIQRLSARGDGGEIGSKNALPHCQQGEKKH